MSTFINFFFFSGDDFTCLRSLFFFEKEMLSTKIPNTFKLMKNLGEYLFNAKNFHQI